ncbi:hypothetical protein SAMN04488097_3390 [Epilithonimonas lactis]|nr:hypothetical protein SAMN04488097_3390 [Epilithonimonas lactis]
MVISFYPHLLGIFVLNLSILLELKKQILTTVRICFLSYPKVSFFYFIKFFFSINL